MTLLLNTSQYSRTQAIDVKCKDRMMEGAQKSGSLDNKTRYIYLSIFSTNIFVINQHDHVYFRSVSVKTSVMVEIPW